MPEFRDELDAYLYEAMRIPISAEVLRRDKAQSFLNRLFGWFS